AAAVDPGQLEAGRAGRRTCIEYGADVDQHRRHALVKPFRCVPMDEIAVIELCSGAIEAALNVPLPQVTGFCRTVVHGNPARSPHGVSGQKPAVGLAPAWPGTFNLR